MNTDTPNAMAMEEPVTTVDQPAADAIICDKENPNAMPIRPPAIEIRTAS